MRYARFYWLCCLLVLAGCTAAPAEPQARLSVAEALGGTSDTSGFARATAPRAFVFPQDHGPHPEYATEWWYYTGNLATSDGRQFGYQLTFFRFGLAPQPAQRASDWAASSIYMAHVALSDIAGKQFYAADRFSRGAAGLAGASGAPFRVWLEDWQVQGLQAGGLPMRLQATTADIALDLTLEAGKPVVLQGDRGLSQKSATAGNASYYYSFTRMPSSGSLTLRGEQLRVTGQSWMDREWSTSALDANQVGWDWFALQLDDGRELMYSQVRQRDGSADTYSQGTLVAADGTSQQLRQGQVELEVLETWRSPQTGARYPAAWRLRVPSVGLDLLVRPQLADQELRLAVVYWEGAVAIEGSANGQPVRGKGYVELTGYVDQSAGVQVR